MVAPTRDPAAYRRIKKAREIERAVQIRKCYEEHLPAQIGSARDMLTCAAIQPVSPVHTGRGVACATIFKEASA